MRKLLLLLGITLLTGACSVDNICHDTGECWYRDNWQGGDHPRQVVALFMMDMDRRGITEELYPEVWENTRRAYRVSALGDVIASDNPIAVGTVNYDGCRPTSVGQMYTLPNPGKWLEIKREYWRTATDGQKIAIMYHELGHLVFGKNHSGDFSDIMFASIESLPFSSTRGLVHGLNTFFDDIITKNYSHACGVTFWGKSSEDGTVCGAAHLDF